VEVAELFVDAGFDRRSLVEAGPDVDAFSEVFPGELVAGPARTAS
jgi:hypothetical protein